MSRRAGTTALVGAGAVAVPGAGTRRANMLVAALAFLAVTAVLSQRAYSLLNVPGHPDAEHWVLQDFRDAIYYPVVAFLDGENPYDHVAYRRTYPVGQVFAPYAPAVLLLYLPFGLLPFEVGELAYFAITLALTVVLAHLSVRLNGLGTTLTPTLAVATLVLLSRPGQQNLLLGQCTAHVVIGCFLALRFGRERPWLGGIGLALGLLKPHFGVPLALLMLSRRETGAVARGVAVMALASALPLAVLVVQAGGPQTFAATLLANVLSLDANPTGHPMSGWARLDAPYLLARVLGHAAGGGIELALGLAVLTVAGLALRRLARSAAVPSGEQLAVGIACLAVLLSVYHQAYDALLLALPIASLAASARRAPWVERPTLRWLLLALLTVPAVNYLATATAIGRLGLSGGAWLAVTGINSAALTIAFAVYVSLAIRRPA